jgi:hypothetical protein
MLNHRCEYVEKIILQLLESYYIITHEKGTTYSRQ